MINKINSDVSGMNRELFEKLIKNPEGDVLDFKEKSYDFSTREHEEAKFLKDLLSFANTVRNSSAYILFGIRESRWKKELLGINDFPDDSILQQKVKDKIYPKIKFKSSVFEYDERLFGIIEIPVQTYSEPLHCCLKLKGLEAGKIYLRRGSSNCEATGRETLDIQAWFTDIKTKVATAGNMRGLIAENLRRLADHTIPLSVSISSCLGLVAALENTQFEGFCHRELTGYPLSFEIYGQAADHRFIEVVASQLPIEIAPGANLSSGNLLKHILKKEFASQETFFYNKSLNELEEALHYMSIKNDKALGSYEIDDKVMFPDSNRPGGKISLYFGLGEIQSLYGRIRKKAIEMLLRLSKK